GKQERNNYCALGSIKSNTGHMTAAAGVAGLIKSVLAMNHRQIPASLGYSAPNPAIDFENSPFFLNHTLKDWDAEQVRRAGISSFGVGGTNVHIVIEEFETAPKLSGSGRPLQLLAWSAKSETSRADYGNSLGNFLKINPESSLADVAYSLNTTRDTFNHRSFVLGTETDDTAENLVSSRNKATNTSVLKVVPKEMVFLFPGQGAQYIQMGRALYDHEKIFKEAVDTCANLLMDDLKSDIRQILFPETDLEEATIRIKDTRYTQPAMFVIEYALAKLWMSWGIMPTLFCGHSIGEFVGAHLAGIFSLEDALHLIATRGRLVSELPEGSMLSVRLKEDQLQKLLTDDLSIAAINSERSCVVSGEDERIKDFTKILEEREVPNSLLATSHAFHSKMMDPALQPFENVVQSLQLNIPAAPVVSTVTGTFLTDAQATDPKYWTNHLRDAIRFSDAMDTILKLEDSVLLEVGPGHTLTTLTRQKKASRSTTVLSSLPGPKNGNDTYPSLLTALGKLWLAGVEPDWTAFYSEQSRRQIVLPSYAFDRKPCWIKPLSPQTAVESVRAEEQVKPDKQTDIPNVKEKEEQQDRKSTILQKISEVILNASGIELETEDFDLNFLELGLDSLILTQIATTCKKEFDIPITFRQLNEELETPELLADYLDQNLPQETDKARTTKLIEEPSVDGALFATTDSKISTNRSQDVTLQLVLQELQQIKDQINLLLGNNSIPEKLQTNGHPLTSHRTPTPSEPNSLNRKEKGGDKQLLETVLPLHGQNGSHRTTKTKSRS
ncbi:MAG: acyltransferase domain-containing protein, partial [Pricia sp.]